jgi:arylsulfatase A-like enzyme
VRQVVKDRLDKNGQLYRFLASAVDTAEKEAGINIGSAYVRADDITDKALAWVDYERAGPRFLWTHYMDVHHPYVPPERCQRVLGLDPVSEREAIRLRRKMIEDPSDVTDEELDTLLGLYDAEIRFTDAEIGRLVDRVREQWNEDTLVIVTADHGEEFREHGRFSHNQTFHDEVIHVPLVMDFGGSDDSTGTTGDSTPHDELVGLLDVTPTIVDYAGGEQSAAFYGHSLRPLLERGKSRLGGEGSAQKDDEWPREHIVGDWAEGNRGGGETRYVYRDRRWKYIETDGVGALYDLDTDPGETMDVTADYPAECDRIRGVVDDHQSTIEATADDLGTVEIDEATKERLRDLGYAE